MKVCSFFLFSFLVPLILYSTCEDKGNVSSIFKCLKHAYGEGERMKEPTLFYSESVWPAKTILVRNNVNDSYMTVLERSHILFQ